MSAEDHKSKGDAHHEEDVRSDATRSKVTRPDQKARMKADVVGLELLPDGRAVAVGLRKVAGTPAVAFINIVDSPEQLSRDVRTGKIRCGRLNLCLPRHKCIAKTLKLPSTDADEVRTMLDYEIEGLVPFREGKAIHAFTYLLNLESGYTEVSAFLAEDDVVAEHIAPITKQGLRLDRVVASSVALLSWARVAGGLAPEQLESTVLVAADRWTLDVAAIRRGELVYSRSVALAGDTKGNSSRLLREAANSLSQAAGHLGGVPERVILLAPEVQTALLEKALRQRGLPGSTSSEGESAIEAVLPASSEILRAVPGQEQLSAAIVRAAGAAAIEFLPELSDFNLLPEALVRVKRRRAFKKELELSGILTGLVLMLAWAFMQVQIHKQQERIDALKAEIAPIKDTALAVAEKREQLRLGEQLSDRDLPLLVLAELYRLTPPGIYVIEMTVKDKEVNIRGQARSTDLAFAYPSALMKSNVLGNVQFHGAHPITKGEGTVTEFRCSCQILTRVLETLKETS